MLVFSALTGADAGSLILETVAALFLLDIDNLAFKFALTANTQHLALELTRVQLSSRDARAVAWGKNAMMFLGPVMMYVVLALVPALESEAHAAIYGDRRVKGLKEGTPAR